MAHHRHRLGDQPIPAGYQIYEDRLDVAGINFRRDDAEAFARKDDGWLELEPDPGNRHDPNAIRVIGCYKGLLGTKRRFIGFVPADIAAVLAASGVLAEVRPRLSHTYVGDTGFINVIFQIIGPATRVPDYRKARFGDRPPPEVNESSLLAEIAKTEKQSKRDGMGVTPRPYIQLAKLFRKQKRYADEVSILERYQSQQVAPGAAQRDISERLVKARKLLAKHATKLNAAPPI